jgi:amino acid transporter
MGTGKITFFCICAVIVLGTLTASASLGPSGLVLWGAAVLFFVVPNMMIISELGTAYPAEGGIYDWIRRAFGKRMSTRAVYLYWLSNGIWMGANYILLTGLINSGLMGGRMTLAVQLPLVITLIWATVAFISYKVDVGVWATVVGATFKILIMLTVGFGGIWYASRHGIANKFNLETLTPSAGSGIGFFSAIIYNVTGFELVACMGKVLRDPAKTMPKAILFSSLAVVGLYVFGSVGILMAIPVEKINLVSGIADAVSPIFGEGSFVVLMVLLFFMLTIIGDQITWSMAPSRAAAEAARGGSLPVFIGKWHPKYQTPVGANIVLGVIGTVVTVVYSFFAAGNAADTFWSLFSFSGTCIISSYLLFYSSFLKLRLSDPRAARPFKMPGGLPVAWLSTGICLLFIMICITLFVFPDILSGKVNLNHSGPIVVGMILILTIGEIIIRRSEKHSAAANVNNTIATNNINNN